MNNQRQREIEALRNKLMRLEQEAEREKAQREALEGAHQQLLDALQEAGVSFDAYVQSFYKEIRRIITRIEKKMQAAATTAPKKRVTKKKRATAKKKRRGAKQAKPKVKIPAGNYRGVPSEPDRLFQVKEKGPRPKALREYAEKVGQEELLKLQVSDGE